MHESCLICEDCEEKRRQAFRAITMLMQAMDQGIEEDWMQHFIQLLQDGINANGAAIDALIFAEVDNENKKKEDKTSE